MAVRAPHLYRSLRCFCLGAFSLLAGDVAGGDELPFAFEEHASRGRPPLYEYRPLVRVLVEARAERLSAARRRRARDRGSRAASRRPRSSRARTPGKARRPDALLRTIVLPLLADVAEACGGFDWSDEAFDRAYAELERSLLGDAPHLRRRRAARRPLGRRAGRARRRASGCASPRPASSPRTGPRRTACCRQASAASPTGSACSSSSASLPPERAASRRTRPGELADAVSALRLATAGAGRRRPGALRAARLAAVRHPARAADRRDRAARRADPARPVPRPARSDLLARLGRAEEDPELAEALDRWELSLFADEPFRSEQLRESLAALLGGPDGFWAAAVRAAVLLGETARDRADLLEQPARARARRVGRSGGCRQPCARRRRGARPRRPRRAGRVARRGAPRPPPAAGGLLRRARLLERRVARLARPREHRRPGAWRRLGERRLESSGPAERLVRVVDAQRRHASGPGCSSLKTWTSFSRRPPSPSPRPGRPRARTQPVRTGPHG